MFLSVAAVWNLFDEKCFLANLLLQHSSLIILIPCIVTESSCIRWLFVEIGEFRMAHTSFTTIQCKLVGSKLSGIRWKPCDIWISWKSCEIWISWESCEKSRASLKQWWSCRRRRIWSWSSGNCRYLKGGVSVQRHRGWFRRGVHKMVVLCWSIFRNGGVGGRLFMQVWCRFWFQCSID